MNLTSNFTLNNIHSTNEVPLVQLLEAGVRCVLGTDGPGLYGTTPGDELRAARLAGVNDAHLRTLRMTELQYLARDLEVTSSRPAHFTVPEESPPRSYTPEVAARNEKARESRRNRLLERLNELNIASTVSLGPLGSPSPAGERVGERAVCIAGAWKQSWATSSAESRARIIAVLEELIPALPADTVLVTGGTSAGVEGEVHRLALLHQRRVLATIVEATDPADLGPGPTEAILLAATPHEKAPKLYGLMKELDALCLFFGGGNVVHDELRAAANLRLRYLALGGVDGASGRHASQVPQRAFHSAGEALSRLDDRSFFRAAFAPFWHPGVNPTVDVVVLRKVAPHPASETGERGASTPLGTNGTGRNPFSPSEVEGVLQQSPSQVLLIRRHDDAAAEPGQWALPGGFVHTHAARGTPFVFDAEQPLETAIRELDEEAGLDVSALRTRFQLIAQVEGRGRDERDSPAAWSRTWLFRVTLEGHRAVAGGDDASDARWFPLDALPSRLAFDHAQLLALALESP